MMCDPICYEEDRETKVICNKSSASCGACAHAGPHIEETCNGNCSMKGRVACNPIALVVL